MIVGTGVLPKMRNSIFSGPFKSRWVLWTWLSGAIALTAASGMITGQHVKWIAAFIMFFEAPSFPFIFEAATIGLREHSTTGEDIMIVSISGGMIGPPAFGAIKDSFGISKAWFLVVAFFCIVWSFPTFTTLILSWREAVDQADEKEENISDNELQMTVMASMDVQLRKNEVRERS